jgi:hypothetical protein
MHTKFWYKSLKRRNRAENLGVAERKILKSMLKEIRWAGVGCIHLARGKAD